MSFALIRRNDMDNAVATVFQCSQQRREHLSGLVLRVVQKHYAANPKDAHALVNIGEKKPDNSIREPELASWTMIASEMLNLDETVNK